MFKFNTVFFFADHLMSKERNIVLRLFIIPGFKIVYVNNKNWRNS